MAEATAHSHGPKRRIDRAWAASAIILALVAIFEPGELWNTVVFTLGAMWHTAPFIAFAVLAAAYLRASGAERLAAIAVWALVKPRIFAACIGLALIGAVLAGLAWQAVT